MKILEKLLKKVSVTEEQHTHTLVYSYIVLGRRGAGVYH